MGDIYVIHTVKHRAEDPFHPICNLTEWITRLTLAKKVDDNDANG